ncbi:hypothetical protein RvY_10959 [Ramazzottius varieornatus]|uniref:Hexosyltransferase n=1 Tax=Ramazzottius varieornatus TaxID=947166 RepID=A0A1D1VGK3_RAMVA|nr:hypothetical protein RvY_10959 [Ramazzottius varieornatus]
MRRQRIILILTCLYALILVIAFCPLFNEDPKPSFGNQVEAERYNVPELYPEFISRECRSGRIWLITITTSSVKNFAERAAIRETWGSITGFDGLQFRMVFVLEDTGLKYTTGVIQNLTIESETSGDLLVQKDKQQSTGESPNKSLATASGLLTGLNWMDETCSNVSTMLRATDGYFINMIGVYWTILKDRTSEVRKLRIVCFDHEEPRSLMKSSSAETEVRRCLRDVFLLSKPLSKSFTESLSIGTSSKTNVLAKTADFGIVDMAFAKSNSSSQIMACTQKYKTNCKLLVGTAKPDAMRTLWLNYQ